MAVLPPLIPLVFPPPLAVSSFNEDQEWDRIAAELDDASQQPSEGEQPSQTFRIDYFPPDSDDEKPVGNISQRFLPIFIPREASQIPDVMAEEVESAYCLYGTDGLRDLLIDFTRSRDNKLINYGRNLPPLPGLEAEKFTSRQEIVDVARNIYGAFLDHYSKLQNRIPALLDKIEKHAQTVAYQQLTQAKTQILDEAARYLALERRSNVNAQRLLETTDQTALIQVLVRGPDLPALVGAIREIQSLQLDLEIQSGMQERGGGDRSAFIEDALGSLTEAMLVRCREFPILHKIAPKIWITSGVQVNAYDRNLGPLVASTASGGRSIYRLNQAIFSTLQTCLRSNDAFQIEIQEDSSKVWRFPPLIQSTLESMADEDPDYDLLSVGARAATERLAEEQGMDWITILSMVTGALDMAAMIGGAAPPVGLTLAFISLVLSVTGSAYEYLRLRTEDRAYNATLNPELALASEPGYTGFVIGVLLTLLDVKGVRDAVKATRLASETTELARLVKI